MISDDFLVHVPGANLGDQVIKPILVGRLRRNHQPPASDSHLNLVTLLDGNLLRKSLRACFENGVKRPNV